MMETLDALSPLSVLERGYSITWRLPSLEVLREAETVRPGDRVKIRLFRGELRCMTEEVLPVCSDATSESE
jgi:exodeoxyribonuclease VII large subunit